MESAIVGVVGILLGIIINEVFRRSSRIENYSSKLFEKRLEIFEELFSRVVKAHREIQEIISNDSLSKNEKLELGMNATLEPVSFCDKNKFYISEELLVMVGSTFVNSSTIIEAEDEKEIEESTINFNTDIYKLMNMIRSDSGIYEIDKHLRKVSKVKYEAPVIDYYKKLKKEYNLE